MKNFEQALDTICPIKGGGDDKRRFFIEGICECVGVGFDVDKRNAKDGFEDGRFDFIRLSFLSLLIR